MSKILINGIEYSLENLPAEALSQVKLLQYTQRKLEDLNKDLTIITTAKNAYSEALINIMKKNNLLEK